MVDVIVVDPLNNVTYSLSFQQGQIDFTLQQSLLPFIESKLYDEYGVVLSNTFLICDGIRVNTLKTDFNDADAYRGFLFNMTFNEDYQQMTNQLVGVNLNSLETPFNIAMASMVDYQESLGYDAGYIMGYEDGVEGVGFFDFIINSAEAFLTAELFPGFSFGLLLMAIVGVSLFIWILKLFAGG